MAEFIDLKSLSTDSLAGIVSIYPWFGAARKEFCVRMCASSEVEWTEEQLSDAAMYIPSRKKLAGFKKGVVNEDYKDESAGRLLKSYISEAGQQGRQASQPYARKVHVVGGDYFTQSQYDDINGRGLSFKLRPAELPSRPENDKKIQEVDVDDVFCTETLAQIYAEQGYYEKAKEIYSKLILAYPEKNAYFAALIGKIELEIKK